MEGTIPSMEYIIPMVNNIISLIASDNDVDLINEGPRFKKCCEDFRGYYWPSKRSQGYHEPDCRDPYYQIAYLYKYAPLRADIITHIFEKETCLRELIENSSSSLACVLGTGPGTELIGLAKWIELRKIEKQIEFILMDEVEEWLGCLYHIQGQISSRTKNIDIIKYYYSNEVYGDIVNDDNLKNIDFYIISYVISEIMRNDEKLSAFSNLMNQLFRKSRRGTKIIFVDRNENSVDAIIRKVVDNDLVSLSEKRSPSWDRYPSSSGSTNNFQIEYDEKLASFGDLYENLKINFNESPELGGNVFWVVGTIN